ncbi:hypothetical protein [Thiomicrorhabdus aquaedulcis]|uniref:hypothetical protein n=1 Tax=Thiomicrorhabdus aquaedulcis TaxID=2211106 RepID=UPI000FD8B80B|nr:hypothetical protein [Thiomicrorhabdus aquaedulcis]
MKQLKKIITLSAFAMVLSFYNLAGFAKDFKVGETVFVAFPEANIKDDAFIIGKVTQITPKGDYQISVIDYVKGHDYGVSCVPMVKNQGNQGYGEGWSVWTDTKNLDNKAIEYRVAKENVLNLIYGKQYFIERNNLYIVFGRWKSDAPMLTIERLERAKSEAVSIQMSDLNDAFDIAMLHRASFYGDFGRPFLQFETIEPLNKLLETVGALLASDPVLKDLWQEKSRDWPTISKNTRHYFLIEAIDKSLADAQSQLYKEGVEQADAAQLAALKAKLTGLQRK